MTQKQGKMSGRRVNFVIGVMNLIFCSFVIHVSPCQIKLNLAATKPRCVLFFVDSRSTPSLCAQFSEFCWKTWCREKNKNKARVEKSKNGERERGGGGA